MIDREKWAEIYDVARYNGFSPHVFILKAWEERVGDAPMHITDASEEEIYEVCLAYSRSRTAWPTSKTPGPR